ncbi:MAG: hypothetical protein H6736_18225 [Alphaproteobacteria bacterium]|nr:hypothetical protein [Alphaproteobacteria bacterium]MCB9693752.1 hypothetical protein [Alphaproteobacteria bacterium]
MLILFALNAQADVVRGPPRCPEGSERAASHGGSWCAPRTAKEGCPDGQEAKRTGLCVKTITLRCGGRRAEPGCKETHEDAVASCDANTRCDEGACKYAQRCVPVPAPPGPLEGLLGGPPAEEADAEPPPAEPVPAETAPAEPVPVEVAVEAAPAEPTGRGSACATTAAPAAVVLLGILPLALRRRR